MTKRLGGLATRGVSGRSRRREPKREPRKLFLKFRVKPLVNMPKSVMFDKLAELVRTGRMPSDLEVSFMSYDHKRYGRFVPGKQIPADEHEDLRRFYEVMVSIDREDVRAKAAKKKLAGTVRLERVD